MNVKKILTAFVSFVTVLWSVGAGSLALPLAAQAATLNAGDLIKASGPAVYFYDNDGKRYVFPNEKTYFSWFSDFSSVKTITDAELAAIMIGGNVTVRPGTKLVKITTDPKVYAVSKCGTLHWIESEAVAKALYGDAWATRVIDVPDSFFVNYSIGSSISTNVHPDGQLITYEGDTNRYVVMDGQKRKIVDDAAFNANHWNMVNSVVTAVTYPDGADVTGAELDNFWTVSCSASSGSVVASGSVTVALASDTPAGATVPNNAMSVPMVKVALTAGASGATVEGLHFHRVGVGSASDFANVYLYDQEGNRLTTGRSVNSSSNMVEFNSLNISLGANETKFFYVYGDFSSPSSTGGNHAFELADKASVVLSGDATVEGSFPVRGNVFVVGTASAGTVTVTKGTDPANPVIGTTNVDIASFKLNAATNDLYIHRVTLYMGGTINNDDLTNLELYQGSDKVASVASVNSKGQIVFNFDAPYLLPNGVTRVFTVKGDVAGRSGRTIKLYVEYATDIYAVDSVYNSGASVNIDSYDGGTNEYSEVTTQGGNLTVAFNGPTTSNVAKGKLGVVFYKFALTSADNDLEIRHLRMQFAGDGAGKLYEGTTPYFRNLKLVNLDTGVTVAGPKELATSGGETATQDLDFSDVFNVKAGETLNLALEADIANSSDSDLIDHAYHGILKAFQDGDIKIVSTGENLALTKVVPNTDTTGNDLTVKESSLTVDLASNPTSGKTVKRVTNKPVLGISLAAGAQSKVRVSNMNITCQAKLHGDANYTVGQAHNRITSVSLWDGDTQVGTAEAPDSSTGVANITNMNLDVDAGTTKVLTAKVNLASTADSHNDDKISCAVASAGDITAEDEDSNTVTPSVTSAMSTTQAGNTPTVYYTILDKGTLTVAENASPSTAIVVAGQDTWVPMAKYKATATDEQINLDRVRVVSAHDTANFSEVAIAKDGSVLGSATLPAGTSNVAVDVDLSAHQIEVPKDGSAEFEIWAKLSNIQSSSSVNGATSNVTRSGDDAQLGIAGHYNNDEWTDADYATSLNVRATGAESGDRIYFTSAKIDGNTQYLRKSKPVVTAQDLSSNTLANGTRDLYKVQIGADSAGSIAVKQITFNITPSAGLTVNNLKFYRGSTDITSDVDILNAAGADLTGSTAASGKVYVVFTNEDVISGSGNIYRLEGQVAGSTSGESLTVSLVHSADHVTGYLLKNASNYFDIDTGDAAGRPDATKDEDGDFVWSDMSEVPHSSADQTSMDWTAGNLVEDMTHSVTLTP